MNVAVKGVVRSIIPDDDDDNEHAVPDSGIIMPIQRTLRLSHYPAPGLGTIVDVSSSTSERSSSGTTNSTSRGSSSIRSMIRCEVMMDKSYSSSPSETLPPSGTQEGNASGGGAEAAAHHRIKLPNREELIQSSNVKKADPMKKVLNSGTHGNEDMPVQITSDRNNNRAEHHPFSLGLSGRSSSIRNMIGQEMMERAAVRFDGEETTTEKEALVVPPRPSLGDEKKLLSEALVHDDATAMRSCSRDSKIKKYLGDGGDGKDSSSLVSKGDSDPSALPPRSILRRNPILLSSDPTTPSYSRDSYVPGSFYKPTTLKRRNSSNQLVSTKKVEPMTTTTTASTFTKKKSESADKRSESSAKSESARSSVRLKRRTSHHTNSRDLNNNKTLERKERGGLFLPKSSFKKDFFISRSRSIQRSASLSQLDLKNIISKNNGRHDRTTTSDDSSHSSLNSMEDPPKARSLTSIQQAVISQDTSSESPSSTTAAAATTMTGSVVHHKSRSKISRSKSCSDKHTSEWSSPTTTTAGMMKSSIVGNHIGSRAKMSRSKSCSDKHTSELSSPATAVLHDQFRAQISRSKSCSDKHTSESSSPTTTAAVMMESSIVGNHRSLAKMSRSKSCSDKHTSKLSSPAAAVLHDKSRAKMSRSKSCSDKHTSELSSPTTTTRAAVTMETSALHNKSRSKISRSKSSSEKDNSESSSRTITAPPPVMMETSVVSHRSRAQISRSKSCSDKCTSELSASPAAAATTTTEAAAQMMESSIGNHRSRGLLSRSKSCSDKHTSSMTQIAVISKGSNIREIRLARSSSWRRPMTKNETRFSSNHHHHQYSGRDVPIGRPPSRRSISRDEGDKRSHSLEKGKTGSFRKPPPDAEGSRSRSLERRQKSKGQRSSSNSRAEKNRGRSLEKERNGHRPATSSFKRTGSNRQTGRNPSLDGKHRAQRRESRDRSTVDLGEESQGEPCSSLPSPAHLLYKGTYIRF
eukprot:scaffold4973_cov135-Cylindrotheca_fusiformis.AAC.33